MITAFAAVVVLQVVLFAMAFGTDLLDMRRPWRRRPDPTRILRRHRLELARLGAASARAEASTHQ